jgi:MinD-like ATPase involved in chromosome partitioning or flagellar assembly
VRVVFASARSSPGVTTSMLACASVWPGRVLLVEASEDGGALAARFGLSFEPGLTTLAAALRHERTAADLAAHSQPLPGTDERLVALVGPSATEQAQVLLRAVASRLERVLCETDETVLIDVGRVSGAPLVAPLIASADRLVLVARPRIEELQALAQRLAVLARLGPAPELLLIGERPYGPAEIGATLGCPVLGVVAHDPAAADALAAVAAIRRLGRSPLLRSAVGVVEQLSRPRTAPVSGNRPGRSGPVAGGAVVSVNGARAADSRWSTLGRP